MVNQKALDYLKQNSPKYPIESLKQKLISSGYSKEEIEEASSLLSSSQQLPGISPSSNPQTLPISNFSSQSFQKPKFKLMKLAGICGIILLILIIMIIFLTLLSFYYPSQVFSVIILIAGISSFILGIIFLLGLIRLGKYTSKLLKVSSIMLLISIITLIVLAIIFFIFLSSMLPSNLPIQGMAIEDFSASSLSGLSSPINPISLSSQALNKTSLLPLIIISLIGLFFLIDFILFSIGLITAGEQVRFAKPAGILSLIISNPVVIALLVILMLPIALLFSSFSSSLVFIIALSHFAILSFLVFLFEILALFNASEKFEA